MIFFLRALVMFCVKRLRDFVCEEGTDFLCEVVKQLRDFLCEELKRLSNFLCEEVFLEVA